MEFLDSVTPNSPRRSLAKVGFTTNLDNRLEQHKKGQVESTKYRRPFMLVYYEVSFNLDSALHREKYLKTTYGHRYLKNRIPDDGGIQI